jgi:hypothetical protein
MKYTVVFSAISDGSMNTFKAFRTFDEISIYINDKLVITEKIDDIQLLFDKYNSGAIDGVHYKDRDLSKLILIYNFPSIIVNLFRSFAVSNVYLNYGEKIFSNDYEPTFINTIKDSFMKYCYHSSLVEWTGDIGSQPVMYFIKEEYKDNMDVNKLYELGLLNKIHIEIDNEIYENYFIPFEIPRIQKIKIMNVIKTWNKLISDMSDELSKLNKE